MSLASSTSLIPLYRQVSERLQRSIMAGEWRAGEALPTEDALCSKFSVSRITVRKALDELVDRHLVVRRRGVGTFVADAGAATRSVTLTGYIEEVLSPNRLVIDREAVVRPPADVLEFAGLAPATKLALFEGTNHLAGGEPLVHLHYYFPPDVASHLSARALAGPTQPIKLVERVTGRFVDHAEQVVLPVSAGRRSARALGVPADSPLLRAIRVYFDADHAPIEIFDAVYHPAHYRYTARLYPRAGRAGGPR